MDSPEIVRGAGCTPMEDTAFASDTCSDVFNELAAEVPSFCFLSASACRLGGPRRLLGLSYVQGISKLAHDRQGGPLSSHYSY